MIPDAELLSLLIGEFTVKIGTLFTFLGTYKIADKILFDLLLAHSLNYYMGLIYEAIVEASVPPGPKATKKPNPAPAVPKKKSKKSGADKDKEIDKSQVGMGLIATGGQYDDLVGMFTAAVSSDGKKGAGLPCIGMSIGTFLYDDIHTRRAQL
ncbi:hypothetical protein EDB85DRAFT_2154613 [Lactarius pseudohatsudake]|nr:hypothetical protein EDB85DRAFT_2154613 [Lactarius pseudohatsudake]